jgi:hypothetical protein
MISFAGVVIVTISALLFLIVFLLDLFGLHSNNPYLGIFFFLLVPGAFILGLLLIPLGIWLERRRRASGQQPSRMVWPRIDLNDPSHRRAVFIVALLTFGNIVIVSLAAYKGIEFMDSPSFCGEVCHEVMEPEYKAYQDGPHSKVSCVSCHIGPGAPFFVKSKLDGTRQVFAVLMNSHARPIPTPVHTLRPAREVCEQCHWPEKFHGDTVQVRKEYADDEQVSETVTTLRIHVGGGSEKTGVATGIHWHMNVANVVEYVATDDKRQVIPWIKVTDGRTGAVRIYSVDGVGEEPPQGERRTMDCVDCHNRPSHIFDATPEKAADRAIAAGDIPRTLPFVRREVVSALKVSHEDKQAALQQIATQLAAFYQQNGDLYTSRRADVEKAIRSAQALYDKNVYPKMKVTFGTYENNIGHMTAPGCFRCHDENHKTKEGRVIGQDCSLCHTIE